MMHIYEVQERSADLIRRLTAIWEDSVRATHFFLSDAEIARLKDYVPQALRGVSHLIFAENEAGDGVAFMGVENGRLEMLFLSPTERGRGIGRQLLEYGMRHYGVRELTVNEQNPQAVGFYERMGFAAYRRTELDEQGAPYPLIYMRLQGQDPGD